VSRGSSVRAVADIVSKDARASSGTPMLSICVQLQEAIKFDERLAVLAGLVHTDLDGGACLHLTNLHEL